MSAKIRTGNYVGTGASLDIEVGFIPEAIILVNQTSGALAAIWFDGMPAGTSIDVAHVGTTSTIATNAAGSTTRYGGNIALKGHGFMTGADNSVNNARYYWLALAGA